MTAETGDEFAVFTRKGRRLVIRGNKTQVPLYQSQASELKAAGYKWSGHTHPGFGDNSLIASDGDRKMLEKFAQTRSVIYNAVGKRVVFGKDF
ncbi:MAG: hypothetical protein FWH20_00695 [Oscillospiraceae bacterium]|nr:hypothetical protein [Oscillospiraceae bacterium]